MWRPPRRPSRVPCRPKTPRSPFALFAVSPARTRDSTLGTEGLPELSSAAPQIDGAGGARAAEREGAGRERQRRPVDKAPGL